MIVAKKPSRILIREQLSNGQYLSMWLWRNRNKKSLDNICFVWAVGIYIGDIKSANKWRYRKQPIKQTGEVGTEGLFCALRHLLAFAQSLDENEELQIIGDDLKRTLAYRWLLRYPGFVSFLDEQSGLYYIAYRSEIYWNQKSTKDELVYLGGRK